MKDPSRERSAQKVLLLVFGLCVAVVSFGCCINNTGLKYSRVSANGRAGDDCSREMLVLSIEDSNFCCDGIRSSDWVCTAAYDKINKGLTSMPWAYLVPFVPLLMTVLFVDSRHNMLVKAQRRFLAYTVVILYRTYVLYVGLDYLPLLYTSTLENDADCWYALHRRKGDCVDNFDFSDHIVFYIAQIFVPCSIEIGYVLSMQQQTSKRWKKLLPLLPTILTACALLFLGLRAIMFTSVYFHTPAENGAGLLIVFLLVIIPIYSLLGQFL
jgi:hypothetical protein